MSTEFSPPDATLDTDPVSGDRRDFLKKSAVATGAAAAFGLGLGVYDSPGAWAADLRKTGRGRVVAVEHPNAMQSMSREDGALVEKMTHEAILRLTGKSTLAQAWRELVSPNDTVGIKLNCLAAPGISTSPAMVRAIVKGLQAVGVPNGRIILYEQYPSKMEQAKSGFALNEDPAKGPLVRHLGGKDKLTDQGFQGYETQAAKHASGTSHYANALKLCTAIISAPVIKDHNLAGITVGMKSMTHGNINNPHDFHTHDCNPQVADIYDHPKIKDKVRVVVCDGLKVLYDGGPMDSKHKVLHNRIYAATDPVAIDAWGWKVIEELRKKHGKPPLATRHPTGLFLKRAEALGLGVGDPARVTFDLKVMA